MNTNLNKTKIPSRPEEAKKLFQDAQAVIFDFDGLLVDTEMAIYSSWVRVFEHHGHELPLDLFNQCLGSGYTHWNPANHLESLTGDTYDWDQINAKRQEEIVDDLTHAGLLRGALEVLDECQRRGLPIAVASSSSHRWVDGWLKKLGIYDRFICVVCRDDNYPVKPNPDLFLAAAERIKMKPEQCLVLEDSENGTKAAHAAGMKVISIPNRVTEEADFSLSNCITSSLCDLL